MRRKFTALLLAVALALGSAGVFPQTSSADDGLVFNIINGEEAVVSGYSGSGGAVEIPSAYGGYPVTGIGQEAFANADNITAVSLPASIKTIGAQAFYSCDHLAAVNIPEGVTFIGSEAFVFCKDLTHIDIPNSIQSIGTRAFTDCTALEAINVTGVNQYYQSIDGVLFAYFNIGNPGKLLFQYPAGRTAASYAIPNGVFVTDNSAFSNADYLTEIAFPEGFTTIGAWSFFGCDGLSEVEMPASLSAIGSYAFQDCSELEKIYFYGDAPDLGIPYDYTFAGTDDDFRLYYIAGKSGWTTPTWSDSHYPTATFIPQARCRIDGQDFYSLSDALSSIGAGQNKTIELLGDINYGYGINISGRSVNFALGGHTLDVMNLSGDGLFVGDDGTVALSGAGAFHVTGLNYGIHVQDGVAAVTTAATLSDGGAAVYAGGNGSATVSGNASSAYALGGGEVSIGGDLSGFASAAGAYSQVTVQGSVAKAIASSGGTVTVQQNVNGIEWGAMADNSGYVGGLSSTVTVYGNVTVSAADAIAAYAKGANTQVNIYGSITANGNIGTGALAEEGGHVSVINDLIHAGNIGARAVGAGSSVIIIGGDVTAAADNGAAVYAQDDGNVTVTGNVTATGNNGRGVKTNGGIADITGNITSSNGLGVDAYNEGIVTVTGDVSGKIVGVSAQNNGSSVEVTGDVAATGTESAGAYAYDAGTVSIDGNVQGVNTGVYAEENSEMTVGGNVTTTDTPGYGAQAKNNSTVTINGAIVAAGGYIRVDDLAKNIGDDQAATTKPGYKTYANGTSTVWVKSGDTPEERTLVSIIAPTAVTGLANGTAKTATALGLPAKVTLETDDGNVQADVTWDVAGCDYDPDDTGEQAFTVDGTVALPAGVINPDNVDLTVSINVTVNAASSTDKTLVAITAPAAITGIANGSAKTAAALGLPAKVTLVTDSGNVQADVSWDVAGCDYDPDDTGEQTFTVDGTVTLPAGVINPNSVDLTVSISVTIQQSAAVFATRLDVSAPGNATAGTSFNFTVTAEDNSGNTATGYTGTVHFTSTDASSSLPSNYIFIALDNGTHTFSAILNTTGSQTITATDSVTASIYGSSSVILVSASSSLSSDATLKQACGLTIIPSGTHAGSIADPYQASIDVASSQASIATSDLTPNDTNAVAALYTDSTFTTPTASVNLEAGAATTVYIRVTAQDASTRLYYAVSVTRAAAATPTISVGLQSGTITAGTAGSATFAVTTTNIDDNTPVAINWCDASGNSLSAPTGLSAAGSNVASNTSTITVIADVSTIEGTYYFTVTSGTATSSVVTVTVLKSVTIGNGDTVNITAPTTIIVPPGVTGAAIKVDTTQPLPLIEVNTSNLLGIVQLEIPAGTTVSGPIGWDGTISLPTVKAYPGATVTGAQSVNAVVEIGLSNESITFSNAVRLLVPGMAGKSAGYIINGVFTPITRVLSTDNQTTADNEIPPNGDAKIDASADLAIWTKHFTEFVAYTPSSGGGSGGGGGGGGTAVSYTPVVKTSAATSITSDAAVLNGSITSDGGYGITNYGFFWGTSSGSLTNRLDVGSNNQSDAFTAKLDSLTAGTTYYFKAYAANSKGTAYGSVLNFTTTGTSQTTITTTTVPKFSDVSDAFWGYTAITNLSGQGIVSGYPNGTFKPDASITRAEFATMLVKALGLNTSGTTSQFKDVSPGDWYYGTVNAAAVDGLVSGTSDNRFAPDALITREQMAVMVSKALGDKASVTDGTELNAFSDKASVSSWAVTGMEAAIKAGIVHGMTASTIAPQADATRAQAAVMVYQLLSILGK
ncbi:MAG: leucine-rich repeat protein [Firmicutes bacterium]|nr:leucine-rich repeat protein [Bacillota bacterium]